MDIHFYEFTFIDELILIRSRWDNVTKEAASSKRLLSENKLKLKIYGNVWLNLASACSETLRATRRFSDDVDIDQKVISAKCQPAETDLIRITTKIQVVL